MTDKPRFRLKTSGDILMLVNSRWRLVGTVSGGYIYFNRSYLWRIWSQ